jgi:hypothetical protein
MPKQARWRTRLPSLSTPLLMWWTWFVRSSGAHTHMHTHTHTHTHMSVNTMGAGRHGAVFTSCHTYTHTHTNTHTHTHTHRHGNAESMRRAFEILTSCLCCGRSTESSYIVRDSIVVDLYHKCVMVEVPMTKVAAFKMVPFVASPHRHLDWWACVCVCVRVCVCGCVRAYVCTYIHSFMHVKHTQVSHVDSVHQHGGLRGA